MPKVKMGQINSENVKSVFRLTINKRTEKFLGKFDFTEEELKEILYLSEEIEYHSDKRYFYQRLILSQKKFTNTVFGLYIDKLFHVDAILHMGTNTNNLTEYNKELFLDYSLVTSANWFVFNFFSKNNGSPVAINVLSSPHNLIYAKNVTRYMNKGSYSVPEQYFSELHRIFDTFTESDFNEWFDNSRYLSEDQFAKILVSYDKMPSSIIEKYYDKSNTPSYSTRLLLATHPNASIEIKNWAYSKTNDTKYLPKDVQDVFVF
jgi:hypothetical protein